jgi:hypothetical protein
MAVTKPHKPSQLVAYKPLTPEQENAVDLLILGKPDREVADTLGFARETVTRWRHEHPVFIAELNRRRQALWVEHHERLRALVGQAVEVIEQAVCGGNLKAAVELLKIVKVHGAVNAPEGATEPEAVLRQRALAQARRELGDEDPTLAMLRSLGGGHEARIHARAEEIMAELRVPFGDASNEASLRDRES